MLQLAMTPNMTCPRRNPTQPVWWVFLWISNYWNKNWYIFDPTWVLSYQQWSCMSSWWKWGCLQIYSEQACKGPATPIWRLHPTRCQISSYQQLPMFFQSCRKQEMASYQICHSSFQYKMIEEWEQDVQSKQLHSWNSQPVRYIVSGHLECTFMYNKIC